MSSLEKGKSSSWKFSSRGKRFSYIPINEVVDFPLDEVEKFLVSTCFCVSQSHVESFSLLNPFFQRDEKTRTTLFNFSPNFPHHFSQRSEENYNNHVCFVIFIKKLYNLLKSNKTKINRGNLYKAGMQTLSFLLSFQRGGEKI